MIDNLLKNMYYLKIEIKEVNNRTKLTHEAGLVPEKLKTLIKLYKTEIMQRQKENEAALDLGFLVYQHGQFYEYQYGRGAFLYIERHPDGTATAWRDNFKPDELIPYKTKIIARNEPFPRVYKEAASFIDWLNKKRGRKGISFN